MYKNYLLIALRTFWRNKIFSVINVLGLAIGISAALVIYLIVSYDLGFDKFEKGAERIYRVVSDMKFPDGDFKNAGVPLPLVPAAQKELTGVETFVPVKVANRIKVAIAVAGVQAPEVYKSQTKIIYTNNNYFKLLPYQWLAGSANNSLNDPYTAVLTESRAKTYFPYDEISKDLGKVIIYNDTLKATITGIVKDLTASTDLNFKEFISYNTLPNGQFTDEQQWGSVSSADQFFIRLKADVSPSLVTKQVQQLFNKHQKDAYLPNIFSLQPLSDIHFNASYSSFDQRLAHMPTLYGLLAVAAILLLLGTINFINLTTAQAVNRAKEIGIRKTMGSSKKQLLIQFFGETFLLTLTATILSVCMVPWIIKLFADFIPPEINFSMLYKPDVAVFILILLLSVTLFAGFYPAMILSKYNPVTILKNQLMAGSSNRRTWTRKSLTVTQFVFAQAFIIVTMIVGSQIHYMLNKDLGFKKDGIITVSTPFSIDDFYSKEKAAKSTRTREVLLHKLQSVPGVAKACIGGSSPASSGTAFQTMKFNNGKKEIETTVETKYADADYFDLYKMKLLAGRLLRRSDSLTEYVINESYARFLGFKNPADAVGKFITRDNGNIPIVGVLHDFYSQSLHNSIKPLAFYSQYFIESDLHIALSPPTTTGAWKASIAEVEKAYKEIYPGEAFKYEFFDENIAKFYDGEQHISTLLSWATGLAIVISCMGLLGLVIYTTNQRTKEIGVRKVLGASLLQIVNLVSKDFLKLVLIAFVIAMPVGWWAGYKWLGNFAYHTNISAWLFVAAGALMVLISIITISIQTLKAASANPIKSLRTE